MWIHSGPEPNPATPPGRWAPVALAVPELLLAEALARVLGEHGLRVVGCDATYAGLLATVRRRRPAVVVVDAELVDGPDGGAHALAELRAAGRGCRLVVLADAVDCALARRMVECGAHAVIATSSPTGDAVATLVGVIRGEPRGEEAARRGRVE